MAGGSISGTALLASAGARSRLANLSAGLLVAPIVLLFAPLVEGRAHADLGRPTHR
jgi:MFS superfamily sulfate permease-like transporter